MFEKFANERFRRFIADEERLLSTQASNTRMQIKALDERYQAQLKWLKDEQKRWSLNQLISNPT